jgi:hypothetical protein
VHISALVNLGRPPRRGAIIGCLLAGRRSWVCRLLSRPGYATSAGDIVLATGYLSPSTTSIDQIEMTVKTETFHSDFVVARFRSACLMKWLQHKHGFNQEDGSDVYEDSRLRYTIRCLCDQRTC